VKNSARHAAKSENIERRYTKQSEHKECRKDGSVTPVTQFGQEGTVDFDVQIHDNQR
jgi:hypothetical protein